MSCEEIKTAIALGPAGFLDDAERAVLRDHIETCESCAMKSERFQGALEAIKDDDAALPTGMFERVLAQAKAAPPLAPLFDEGEAPSRAIVLALSCAFCHGPLSRDEACYCASCLTPHHDDCFRTHGRCTALGCEEVAVVRPRGIEGGARPRRSRLRVWGAGLGLALAIGGGAAALIDPDFEPFAAWPPARVAVVPGSQSSGSVGVIAARPPSEPAVNLDCVNRDLREVMEELGRQTGRNILVDAGIDEVVTIKLSQVPLMDAVQIIAQLCRCRIEEPREGVLLLTRPPKVTIEFNDADLRTVVQLLAADSGKNIVIAPGVSGRACLDLKDVDWDLALEAVAEAFDIQIRERGGIILLTEKKSEWGAAMRTGPSFDAILDENVEFRAEGSLSELAKSVGGAVGLAIAIEDPADGERSLEFRGTARGAVRALAELFEREALFEGGRARLRRCKDNAFRARGVDARAWFKALARLGRCDVIVPRAAGRLDYDATSLPASAVLKACAEDLGLGVFEKGTVATIRPVAQSFGNDRQAGEGEELRLEAAGEDLRFELRLDAILGRFGAAPEALAIVNDAVLAVGDPVLGLDGAKIGSFTLREVKREGIVIADDQQRSFAIPFKP